MLGGLIGGALGFLGQRQTNDANKDMNFDNNQVQIQQAALNREFQQTSADKQMSFQSAQASRQQEFQERMSSTAHQREQQDLIAAGINPLVSSMKSGASTPAGASGSGSSAPGSMPNTTAARIENPFAAMANAAKDVMAIKQAEKQGQLIDAQTENTNADTVKKGVDTTLAKKNIPQAEVSDYLWQKFKGVMHKFNEAYKSKAGNGWSDNDYKIEINKKR